MTTWSIGSAKIQAEELSGQHACPTFTKFHANPPIHLYMISWVNANYGILSSI